MLRHHRPPSFPSPREVLTSPAASPVLLHLFFSSSSPSAAAAPPFLRAHRRLRPGRAAANSSGEPGDGLTGFLGQQVEALLKKEENRALLDGLEEATTRVDAARRALAEIERQEADAARAKELVLQLQAREAEIAETEREVQEARAMVEEAERTLAANIGESTAGDAGEGDRDLERLESVKAAAISSAAATLAALPISAYQATSTIQFASHLGVFFLAAALFGVTFRYTVRRDLNNTQLKTGTCAAFAFVKGKISGLSAAEASSSWDSDGFLQLAASGAAYVSEGMFIFLFSAVALDFCFKTGLLNPFPIRK